MDIPQNGTTGQGAIALTGGLVPPMTIGRFYEWMNSAQPGARLRYFSGFFAGDGDEQLNELLRMEQERGMLFLVQQRRPRPFGGADYLAVRSSRPIGSETKPNRRAPGLQAEIAAAFGGRR